LQKVFCNRFVKDRTGKVSTAIGQGNLAENIYCENEAREMDAP